MNDCTWRLVDQLLDGPDVIRDGAWAAADGGIPGVVDLDPARRYRTRADILSAQDCAEGQGRQRRGFDRLGFAGFGQLRFCSWRGRGRTRCHSWGYFKGGGGDGPGLRGAVAAGYARDAQG